MTSTSPTSSASCSSARVIASSTWPTAAQAGWEAVPVLMLTAKNTERDTVRALDAGANDFIIKPFQPQELLARLRRFLAVS